MKQNVPVTSIMTTNIVKLNCSDNLAKAEALFKQYKIGHIPVVSEQKIIGILSYTDLLRVSFVEAVDDEAENVEATVYNAFTIEQVMVKKVVTISPETSIKEAAEIFAKSEFHSLPVCEEDLLVGIITTTDLIKYFLEQYNAGM
jgi:CBS domain-containing membrane protein